MMGRFTTYYDHYNIKCDLSTMCGCELCCGEAYIDTSGNVVYLDEEDFTGDYLTPEDIKRIEAKKEEE
tara:strand:- start:174 stop:377 length:204 start_codon:yes stop_codon:yes gene_type:complete